MITVVSGVPRSGTSLMMQMLTAGGLPVLTDDSRQADTDNPRGYYEWEPIKQLPQRPELVAEAEGKGVKVISSLLMSLPPGYNYRIIFMLRPLAEVIASQAEMIRRRGTTGAQLAPAALAVALEAHLKQVGAWLSMRSELPVLRVDYHRVLREPRAAAEEIQRFLGLPLDVEAMSQ